MLRNLKNPIICVCIVGALISLSIAQRRPVLQSSRRDYFAGKLLLIPRDARPSSLQQPEMIAKIADHDLITPPVSLLVDHGKILEWAKGVDYDQIDGAIISIETLTGNAGAEIIRKIRKQRPGIPIFASLDATISGSNIDLALDLVADLSIDHLIINETPARSAKLGQKISAQKLSGRVTTDSMSDGATAELTARMLNRRLGFAPRILPVYSSTAGRDEIFPGVETKTHQAVHSAIEAVGGIDLPQTSQTARGVDILFFVHTARTSDQDRKAFVEAIAQTIDKNVRIGLADLSESKETKEALVAELRRLKLPDKLASYASADPERKDRDDALARSIAQASSFLNAIRFMRDDMERVRRVDRAQVGLLLSRYLSDLGFNIQIRPKLQSFIRDELKSDSISNSQNLERAEAFTLDQIKPLADELFNNYFRRNIHGFLLSNGERAQFELKLLQRLQMHLVIRASSPPGIEIELNPAVYLAHVGNAPSPQLQYDAFWELNAERVDERVAAKWDTIQWPSFKTDAETVAMNIKIVPQTSGATGAASLESYSIAGKRSRSTRRIEISSPSGQGAYYALGKLRQMGVDGLLSKDFQLNESPAFTHRGVIDSFSGYWSQPDRLNLIRAMGSARINRYYFIEQPDRPLTGKEIEKIKELARAANENFIQFAYGIEVSSSDEISYEDESALIIRNLDLISSLGVRNYLIAFKGDKSSGSPPAKSHALLINRVREHLSNKYESIEFSVIPEYIENQESRRAYLKELAAAIPAETRIITEPMPDLAAIVNRAPIVIEGLSDDNSFCLSPVAASTADSNGLGMAIRPTGYLQASLLILETAADMLWEGRQYNSQRSFDRLLSRQFDERSRAGVLAWINAYGDCRSNSQFTEKKLIDLSSALEAISGTRDRGLLRGEMAEFIGKQRR